MALFEYIAKNQEGKVFKGRVDELSKSKVIDILHSKNLVIISISDVKKKLFDFKFAQSVTPEEIVIFCRQLTTLIDSGVSLVQSVEILNEQTKNQKLREILSRVLTDVREGNAFHASLAKFPAVFSSFVLSMIKAGEASGNLPEILDRVSTYLEESLSLQRKVKSSLTYPAVVICMAIAITTFLIVKVIPTFKGIFDSLGGTLPLPTQMLLSLSDFLSRFIFLFLGILVAAGIAFKRYLRTDRGKKQFDFLILKLPIIGDLLRKVAIAQFCRTFSTLVRSGVPILNTLDIVGATSGNKIIEAAVLTAKKSVQEGEPLSEPLARTNIFPIMVTRMIAIGEKTGKLQEMLSRIADFYTDEVNTAVEGLTSIIEPLIIGILGVVIGGIVIALFLPILKITELVGA